jgi:hypothetical protein
MTQVQASKIEQELRGARGREVYIELFPIDYIKKELISPVSKQCYRCKGERISMNYNYRDLTKIQEAGMVYPSKGVVFTTSFLWVNGEIIPYQVIRNMWVIPKGFTVLKKFI